MTESRREYPNLLSKSFPGGVPDGERILYYDFGIVRYDSETRQAQHDTARRGIWLMDVNSGEKKKLLSAGYADWSPDGSSVVFEAGAQIYTARIAGEAVDSSSIVQLTPGGRNFFPAWSPDGEWIAYSMSLCDGPKTCGVWVVSAKGEQYEHLADYGIAPSWHPLETTVVFFTGAVSPSGETLGDSLWQQELSTRKRHLIGAVLGQDRTSFYPRYSPDGRQIVFQSDWQVWVMSADGRDPKPLTFDQGGMPDWSPDGRRIVYIGPGNTVWLMDSEGQNRRQLTFRPGP